MHLGMHHALYDASSLRHMLQDLDSILSHEKLEPARSIEHAVKTIVGKSVEDQASKAFWKEKAATMVVNPFPTMTDLRASPPNPP